MTRLGVAAALVDDVLMPGDVAVEDGRVIEVGLPAGPNGLAVPGLVDLQVNGYAGVDFLTDGAPEWVGAARAMARAGVTAFVANLITAPEPMTLAALRIAAEVSAAMPVDVAQLLGVHLEGPFLSPARAGTHPVEHLRPPDAKLAERLLAAGPVVAVTLAPELPGALDLVTLLRSSGVLVSLGHSDATASQADAGFDAGARAVTHIFNAMSTPTARAAGLAGVALARADVAVQMICDGVHLTSASARLVIAAAPDRFVLVTDALAAAGMGDGRYQLGPVEVVVLDGQARRTDGTLAGSLLSMAAGIRGAVEAGASVGQAVAAATVRPATLVGRPDLGRLRPGATADITVLHDTLEVARTYRAGVPVS
ncbi:MAG: N-acetylglucosamine-6-phosphate deacetylase [Sporichthyaceae bacterium]